MTACAVLDWPLSYLGFPLVGNPNSAVFWDPVVRKISKKLDNWNSGLFLLGDHVSLIECCLLSISLYYLSLTKIPIGVADNLERFMLDI